MRTGATIGVVLMLAFLGGAAQADGYLDVEYQAPLILKLLTYEKNLMELHSQTIELGVIYRPQNPDSKRTFLRFQGQLKLYEDRTIHNRRLVVVPLQIMAADSVGAVIRNSGVDAVYVGPGFDDDLLGIQAITRRHKILSMTGIPAYVEAGLTVAVVRRGDQAGITLNLESSKEEGRDWDASLLQLCRIIR